MMRHESEIRSKPSVTDLPPARSGRRSRLFFGLSGRAAIVGLVLLAEWSGCRIFAAESTSSDSHALSQIFAEQHVVNTSYAVHHDASELSSEERYRFLTQWVLPNDQHDTLRMEYAFAPTNPAPANGKIPVPSGDWKGQRRLQSGGNIIAPVYDLLDMAAELDRLDDVYRRVVSWNVEGRLQDRRHRAAMLVLIELSRQREASAVERLDAFLRLLPERNSSLTDPTSSELLVFHRCVDNHATREAVRDALHRYLPWTRSDWNRTPVRRHVSAMLGRLRAFEKLSGDGSATPISQEPLSHWSSVSRATAATRGTGCPLPRWDFRPGHVENVISHDDDYLYFRIPLRGDFEVECDVSGFGWRESHLMVCGTWVAPVYTHSGYDVGNFHMTMPRVGFAPPLTKTKEWIHYRTVVRNRTVSTYFNGRLVRQELVSSESDPWIAIRSPLRQDGAVRNLRITGQPVIPDSIRLSADPEFSGWLSYFGNPIGGPDGLWQQAGRADDSGEIIGNGISKPGSFVASLLNAFGRSAQQNDDENQRRPHGERLLRYHRPMLEDGTIEYEFFYSPGVILTHPALDRLAFMLTPDGVKVHWVTDGDHERTGLSPSNLSDEPENRRGPGRLPLKAGSWNQMQVQLIDDTVLLRLNGQLIYERPVDPCNQRTFGLFYFADESQARVRNIVWNGNWPRQLPPLNEQELAIDDTGFLDSDADRLSSVFDHDFVKDGLPLERFAILRGDPKAHVRHDERGLLTTRPGTGGYRNATIAPGLKVHGDFDIIATYTDFESSAARDGNGSAWLLAILDNATADEFSVARRHVHRANDVNENIAMCLQVVRPIEGERRDYFGNLPMEESSGRLRLSRRGNQMYFLTAEGDSPNFQLRGQRRCATDDIQFEGLRLLTQIYQTGGAVSVAWSRLIVKAEGLSGRAVEDFDSQLVKLNKERDQLKAGFSWDFAKQAPPETLLQQWADFRPWSSDNGGFLIVAPGTDNWTSAGASVVKSVVGDFDLAVTFDVLRLDTPKPGERCSVYTQIELPDDDNTQFSVIFTKNADGRTEVIAQVREPRGQGGYNYRPTGAIDLEDVTMLRIARRGERLTFLASTNESKRDRIVGYLDRPAVPIPATYIRFYVHTGGTGRESRVVWKSLDIRADRIGQLDVAASQENDRGLLDGVFDLLRSRAASDDSESASDAAGRNGKKNRGGN